mgnify:CR=1 FL=1
MYKLRIYKTYGGDKGNLDHEEIFDTKEQMDKRREIVCFESYCVGICY